MKILYVCHHRWDFCSLFMLSVDIMLVIGFQCLTSSASVGLMNHPLPVLRRRGGNWSEGTCYPASDSLFFHVNVSVVLYPGHHLPFF